MINALIQWSLSNRLAVLLISGLLLFTGTYVAVKMPVDVFPDLTAPTVTILVEGHGMAPVEMETLVTFPIETAVNGAANVRRVRSATAVGTAVVDNEHRSVGHGLANTAEHRLDVVGLLVGGKDHQCSHGPQPTGG